MKHLFKLFVLIFFSIFMKLCVAGCTNVQYEKLSVTIPDIIIPQTPVVGSVLTSIDIPSTSGKAKCGTGTAYSRYLTGQPTGQKYLNINDIYSTNIPGIGFALCFSGCATPVSVNGSWPAFSNSVNGNWPDVYFTRPFTIVLIVTGEVTSGKLNDGVYGQTGIDNTPLVDIQVNASTINRLTCESDNHDLEVNFGDVSLNEFTAIGSTTQSKEISFGLTCNSNANVSVTLEGQKNTKSSSDNLIALTNPGDSRVASGLAVQVLYNNSPLKIGTPVPLQNVNGNIKEILPFEVRYYQTKNEVTSGDANATATLVISYQ